MTSHSQTRYRVRLDRSGPLTGTAAVPGSKSQTNRALVLGALSTETTRVTNGLGADDARHMVLGLRAMGIRITELDGPGVAWEVEGGGGTFPDLGVVTVDAGLAGTALRFLAAAGTLSSATTVITGRPPLLRRPVGELIDAIRGLGGEIDGSGAEAASPR